jgi:hypothetical protein
VELEKDLGSEKKRIVPSTIDFFLKEEPVDMDFGQILE